MSGGIVLELQRDCLDSKTSVSTILRKSKAIASKLELTGLQEWMESELNGYECSLNDLPEHRKGIGAPKFKNPYHGWCPIVTDEGRFGQIIRTVYLRQSVSELESVAADRKTDRLIMYYDPTIEAAIHEQMITPMECGLHFSKSLVVSALEFVRNKTLDWTLELESRAILGDGYTFREEEKREARMITNHIYGGNVGVIGDVSGDVKNSRFVNSQQIDPAALVAFIDQAIPAAAGMSPTVQVEVAPLLEELKREAQGNGEQGRLKHLLGSLRTVLEGAGGNLVASALLTAMSSVFA